MPCYAVTYRSSAGICCHVRVASSAVQNQTEACHSMVHSMCTAALCCAEPGHTGVARLFGPCSARASPCCAVLGLVHCAVSCHGRARQVRERRVIAPTRTSPVLRLPVPCCGLL